MPLEAHMFENGVEERQQATLGGVVEVAENCYGLTVNHLFHAVSNGSQEANKMNPGSDSDSDDEWNGKGYMMSEDDTMLGQGRDVHSRKIICKKSGTHSTTSDWTLLEDASFRNAVNMIILPSHGSSETETVFVTEVNTLAPRGKVFICTRRGIIIGFSQDTPALADDGWPLPGLTGELWAIQAQNMNFRKSDIHFESSRIEAERFRQIREIQGLG